MPDSGPTREAILEREHKNDDRGAEAIAEVGQRPTLSFVAIKIPVQMDLLAFQRVRSRLVSQRTGVPDPQSAARMGHPRAPGTGPFC